MTTLNPTLFGNVMGYSKEDKCLGITPLMKAVAGRHK